MYVVYCPPGFIHQLIPVSQDHFERASENEFEACPVYYLESSQGLKVWPAPAKGYVVCKLVPQELLL